MLGLSEIVNQLQRQYEIPYIQSKNAAEWLFKSRSHTVMGSGLDLYTLTFEQLRMLTIPQLEQLQIRYEYPIK